MFLTFWGDIVKRYHCWYKIPTPIFIRLYTRLTKMKVQSMTPTSHGDMLRREGMGISKVWEGKYNFAPPPPPYQLETKLHRRMMCILHIKSVKAAPNWLKVYFHCAAQCTKYMKHWSCGESEVGGTWLLDIISSEQIADQRQTTSRSLLIAVFTADMHTAANGVTWRHQQAVKCQTSATTNSCTANAIERLLFPSQTTARWC